VQNREKRQGGRDARGGARRGGVRVAPFAARRGGRGAAVCAWRRSRRGAAGARGGVRCAMRRLAREAAFGAGHRAVRRLAGGCADGCIPLLQRGRALSDGGSDLNRIHS
jgi:hypothetical protein